MQREQRVAVVSFSAPQARSLYHPRWQSRQNFPPTHFSYTTQGRCRVESAGGGVLASLVLAGCLTLAYCLLDLLFRGPPQVSSLGLHRLRSFLDRTGAVVLTRPG